MAAVTFRSLSSLSHFLSLFFSLSKTQAVSRLLHCRCGGRGEEKRRRRGERQSRLCCCGGAARRRRRRRRATTTATAEAPSRGGGRDDPGARSSTSRVGGRGGRRAGDAPDSAAAESKQEEEHRRGLLPARPRLVARPAAVAARARRGLGRALLRSFEQVAALLRHLGCFSSRLSPGLWLL